MIVADNSFKNGEKVHPHFTLYTIVSLAKRKGCGMEKRVKKRR